MKSQKTTLRLNGFKFVIRLSIAFISTSLALGTASFEMQSANGAESEVKSQNQPSFQRSTASTSTIGLPDGVYLYGQSSKPNELGKGYFVFESKQGKVIGALYMPRSSFDCATGTFNEKQLALTVTNTYDRITNPFEIALERTATVATNGNPAIPEVSLQGFHKINTVSENDQRILNTCKADLEGQAKR